MAGSDISAALTIAAIAILVIVLMLNLQKSLLIFVSFTCHKV
ncbi:hypothetical protein NOC27_2329 [Nitrosococcus oceani AFC27]|nr:hypothetical protein NOC27_2329 [Nitrosococcus oceani AFC27]